jgi:type II secretory pathway component PulC
VKNKKATYLLMPIVIGIWIYVFYVLVGNKDKGNNNTLHFSNGVQNKRKKQMLVDSFSINANYRDPFLDVLTATDRTEKSTSFKAQPVKAQPVVGWPKIAYLGIIKNQTGNKQLTLIQIDGKQNRMQLNQQVNGLTLIKITKDSIQVKFNKEMKYVKR